MHTHREDKDTSFLNCHTAIGHCHTFLGRIKSSAVKNTGDR